MSLLRSVADAAVEYVRDNAEKGNPVDHAALMRHLVQEIPSSHPNPCLQFSALLQRFWKKGKAEGVVRAKASDGVYLYYPCRDKARGRKKRKRDKQRDKAHGGKKRKTQVVSVGFSDDDDDYDASDTEDFDIGSSDDDAGGVEGLGPASQHTGRVTWTLRTWRELIRLLVHEGKPTRQEYEGTPYRGVVTYEMKISDVAKRIASTTKRGGKTPYQAVYSNLIALKKIVKANEPAALRTTISLSATAAVILSSRGDSASNCDVLRFKKERGTGVVAFSVHSYYAGVYEEFEGPSDPSLDYLHAVTLQSERGTFGVKNADGSLAPILLSHLEEPDGDDYYLVDIGRTLSPLHEDLVPVECSWEEFLRGMSLPTPLPACAWMGRYRVPRRLMHDRPKALPGAFEVDSVNHQDRHHLNSAIGAMVAEQYVLCTSAGEEPPDATVLDGGSCETSKAIHEACAFRGIDSVAVAVPNPAEELEYDGNVWHHPRTYYHYVRDTDFSITRSCGVVQDAMCTHWGNRGYTCPAADIAVSFARGIFASHALYTITLCASDRGSRPPGAATGNSEKAAMIIAYVCDLARRHGYSVLSRTAREYTSVGRRVPMLHYEFVVRKGAAIEPQ